MERTFIFFFFLHIVGPCRSFPHSITADSPTYVYPTYRSRVSQASSPPSTAVLINNSPSIPTESGRILSSRRSRASYSISLFIPSRASNSSSPHLSPGCPITCLFFILFTCPYFFYPSVFHLPLSVELSHMVLLHSGTDFPIIL